MILPPRIQRVVAKKVLDIDIGPMLCDEAIETVREALAYQDRRDAEKAAVLARMLGVDVKI